MNKRLYILLRALWAVVALDCIVSCDDMRDANEELSVVTDTTSAQPKKLYVLSEGLFNMNNSTLAMYDFPSQSFVSDFFSSVNQRGLGDTANDMEQYGSKIYIVVNVSSQVEVIDAKTGVSLKRIPLFNDANVARQPRYVDFYGGKAYVCNFDGTVARIDTSSLAVESYVAVGRNPDGICHANNKLYVSNSGGLDYPNYDSTVSVIDIPAFKETKRITVGKNPGAIHADSQGDVYVVSRGDYSVANHYKWVRISSEDDKVVQRFDDLPVLNFYIYDNVAYLYNYDFASQIGWIKTFDCRTETIKQDPFITDGTAVQTPYAICADSKSGNVFVAEAYSFTTKGDILCFDKTGKLKYRLNNMGLNPNHIIVEY